MLPDNSQRFSQLVNFSSIPIKAGASYYRYTNNLNKGFKSFCQSFYPGAMGLEDRLVSALKEARSVDEAYIIEDGCLPQLLRTAEVYILSDGDFRASLLSDRLPRIIADTQLFIELIKKSLVTNLTAMIVIQSASDALKALKAETEATAKAITDLQHSFDLDVHTGSFSGLIENAVKLLESYKALLIKVDTVKLMFIMPRHSMDKVFSQAQSFLPTNEGFEDMMAQKEDLEEKLDELECWLALTSSFFNDSGSFDQVYLQGSGR